MTERQKQAAKLIEQLDAEAKALDQHGYCFPALYEALKFLLVSVYDLPEKK